MKVLRYSQFLDLLTALDEYTNCKHTRRELSKLIFSHFIEEGSFLAYNSRGTKGIYSTPHQEKDFVKFMNVKNKKRKRR